MKSLWRPILLYAPTLTLFFLTLSPSPTLSTPLSPSPTLSTPLSYQDESDLDEQHLVSLFQDRLDSHASFILVPDIHQYQDGESYEDNEDPAEYSLIPEPAVPDFSLIPESEAIQFLRARDTRSGGKMFTRLGRSPDQDSSQRVQRAQQAFMRIGRAPASMYTRIGKSSPSKSSAYTRIGRAASNKQFMRLGRSSTKQFMRLGRAAPSQQFTRLGKAAPSQQFTRLGRAASSKQFMRLGRSSTKQFMRLGRAPSMYTRIGRSYKPYTRKSRASHLYTRMGRSPSNNKHHQMVYRSNDALKRADHIFTRIGRSGAKADQKRQGLFTRMGRSPAPIPVQHQTSSQTSFDEDDDMQLFINKMAAINNYPTHMDADELYRTNYEDDFYGDDIDDDGKHLHNEK